MMMVSANRTDSAERLWFVYDCVIWNRASFGRTREPACCLYMLSLNNGPNENFNECTLLISSDQALPTSLWRRYCFWCRWRFTGKVWSRFTRKCLWDCCRSSIYPTTTKVLTPAPRRKSLVTIEERSLSHYHCPSRRHISVIPGGLMKNTSLG